MSSACSKECRWSTASENSSSCPTFMFSGSRNIFYTSLTPAAYLHLFRFIQTLRKCHYIARLGRFHYFPELPSRPDIRLAWLHERMHRFTRNIEAEIFRNSHSSFPGILRVSRCYKLQNLLPSMVCSRSILAFCATYCRSKCLWTPVVLIIYFGSEVRCQFVSGRNVHPATSESFWVSFSRSTFIFFSISQI